MAGTWDGFFNGAEVDFGCHLWVWNYSENLNIGLTGRISDGVVWIFLREFKFGMLMYFFAENDSILLPRILLLLLIHDETMQYDMKNKMNQQMKLSRLELDEARFYFSCPWTCAARIDVQTWDYSSASRFENDEASFPLILNPHHLPNQHSTTTFS